MSLMDIAAYVNMILSFIGASLYIRNAIASKQRHWKIHKAMTAVNLLIIASVYFMYIINLNVNPIVVRLNTTLIVLLLISNAVLGRSKYGSRT